MATMPMMETPAEGKKRSPVWRYFRELAGTKRVECGLCKTTLSYAGGSTGTMKNHLKLKHKLYNLDEPEVKPQSRQSAITAYKTPVFSKDKWVHCTKKLAAWCAMDIRPLSITAGPGFKEFMCAVAPGYKIPSRPTVSKYLELEYAQRKQTLMELLHDKPIALTTDLWTSAANEGYITLTTHFIDDKWSLCNYVLGTREVTGRHTGEHIATEIRSITRDFGIDESKVVGLVTDNAGNMMTCGRALECEHILCFAHTLQLSIRGGIDSVPQIKTAVAAGRRIVSHFKRSVLSSTQLETRQKQNGLPVHTLMNDCATRWNSSYLMIDRLLEQRVAVYAVLHDTTIIKRSDAATLDITDAQWGIFESLVSVPKPFYLATTVMSTEEYPTLSSVFPITYSLVNHHLHDHDDDPPPVARFKGFVRENMTKRFHTESDLSTTDTTMLSSFLDPRYKALPFLTPDQVTSLKAEALLRVEAQDRQAQANNRHRVRETDSDTEPSQPTGSQSPTATGATTSTAEQSQDNTGNLTFLLSGYYQASESEAVPAEAEAQIEAYMSSKPINPDEDPFKWWSVNWKRFPLLAPLVRKVLCIPGTEVPSERVFSVAGSTITKRRTLLASSNVDKLVFLHKFNRQIRETPTTSECAEPEFEFE